MQMMPILPLFPLDIVLFPNMRLQLHIFEERYKLMVRRCLERDTTFGIIYSNSETDALTHDVGCEAEIIAVEHLPDEKMNIAIIGKRRFRVLGLDHSEPYLLGEVDYVNPRDDDPQAAREHGKMLRALFIRYLEILAQRPRMTFDAESFPDAPLALAYASASLLNMSNEESQQMLRQENLTALFKTLIEIYRRQIMLLNIRQDLPGADTNIGPFSSN